MWTSSTVGGLPASKAGVRESKVRISAVDVWKLVVGLAFLAARLSARHVALRECHDCQWCTWSTKSLPLQIPPIARWNQRPRQRRCIQCQNYRSLNQTKVPYHCCWARQCDTWRLRWQSCRVEHYMDTIEMRWATQKKELFLIPRFLHSGFFPISIPISHQPSQILSTVAAKTSKVMPSIPWKRDEICKKTKVKKKNKQTKWKCWKSLFRSGPSLI